jgi:hypothetical protein
MENFFSLILPLNTKEFTFVNFKLKALITHFGPLNTFNKACNKSFVKSFVELIFLKKKILKYFFGFF